MLVACSVKILSYYEDLMKNETIMLPLLSPDA